MHLLAKITTSQKFQLIIDMICIVQCGFVEGQQCQAQKSKPAR
jgi:hypothetical protein